MQHSARMCSPAPCDFRTGHSNRLTPVTPTPKRAQGSSDLTRSPISAVEFSAKKSSRDDSVFRKYKASLRLATTLVTFEWDAENSKGTLVPIQYPLDGDGQPVDPLQLPNFLETRNWDRPSCFCLLCGSHHKAQFLVPTWRDSPSYNAMCLVCPESECSYFVNVSELMEKYKDQVLSVKDTDSTEGDSEASNVDITAEAGPKKRKRDLRKKVSRKIETVPGHGVGPSSESRPQSHPDDQLSAGLASTISNLLCRHGVLQEQFYKEFRVCDYCRRIVCNDTSRRDGHVCVIEVED
ncbi:hypothetical protein BJ322DRAFT_1106776 [Thelephora terrestris]|uniref:Uncharacterized protein n=1 Tax=Thelephora terrestris TaxID=56493 RepID=A0A9P6HGS4_9AGAM|nr:hypothetical protein BJ322DRAFT_1106776 [Thelephora terrestris]